MCGIAGFITENRDYDSKKIVSNMLKKISHRGPDQSDFESYDDTTIGMVRLCIIDCTTHPIPLEAKSKNYEIE